MVRIAVAGVASLCLLLSPLAPPQAPSLIEHDSVVATRQPGPHNGGGETTAYSFFARAPDLHLVFRKRALHRGAAIGYHRQEEARHLAFARTTVGEHYRQATWTDRFAVRRIVPIGIVGMFDMMVQPLVYRTIGLPAIRTWSRVRRQPHRIELRRQCARAVLDALIDAGAIKRGRIPRGWRKVAGVKRDGSPLPA